MLFPLTAVLSLAMTFFPFNIIDCIWMCIKSLENQRRPEVEVLPCSQKRAFGRRWAAARHSTTPGQSQSATQGDGIFGSSTRGECVLLSAEIKPCAGSFKDKKSLLKKNTLSAMRLHWTSQTLLEEVWRLLRKHYYHFRGETWTSTCPTTWN